MAAADPVTDLMNDHRLIESVMSALERKLMEDATFPAEFVGKALSFFMEYADQFHHFKEEETLFPALAERGVPVEHGPIGMMLQEHAMGRRLVAGMRDNLQAAAQGSAEAGASVKSYAFQYTELLRSHIWKEDKVLFEMARRVLDGESERKLLQQFEQSVGARVSRETLETHRLFASQLG